MRDILLGLILCVGLGGCATHDVRCEGPLQPINVRHPAQDAREHLASDPRVTAP